MIYMYLSVIFPVLFGVKLNLKQNITVFTLADQLVPEKLKFIMTHNLYETKRLYQND